MPTGLQFPDPQSMVMDWAGAFNTALNTALKMRQLGLENEWKERSAKLAEDNFLLRQEEARATISQAEANTQRQRDELAFKKTMWDAEASLRETNLKTADEKYKQILAENKLKQDDSAAKNAMNGYVLNGTFGAMDAAKTTLTGPTTDPLAVKDAYDTLASESARLTPSLYDVSVKAQDPRIIADAQGRMTAATTIGTPALMQTKRHGTGRFARTITSTASPDAAIRAANGRNFDDLPPDVQAQLFQAAQSPETKVVISDAVEVRYTTQEVLDGVRMGNEEKTKIFLRDSLDKKRAAQYILDNGGAGNKAALLLHDVMPPSAAEYQAKPPQVDDFFSTRIAVAMRDAGGLSGQATETRTLVDPKTKERVQQNVPLSNPDGTPKTNLDAIADEWRNYGVRFNLPVRVREYGNEEIQKLREAAKGSQTTKPPTAPPVPDATRDKAYEALKKPEVDRTVEELDAINVVQKREALEQAGRVTGSVARGAKKAIEWPFAQFGRMVGEEDARRAAISGRMRTMTPKQIMESGDQELIDAYEEKIGKRQKRLTGYQF